MASLSCIPWAFQKRFNNVQVEIFHRRASVSPESPADTGIREKRFSARGKLIVGGRWNRHIKKGLDGHSLSYKFLPRAFKIGQKQAVAQDAQFFVPAPIGCNPTKWKAPSRVCSRHRCKSVCQPAASLVLIKWYRPRQSPHPLSKPFRAIALQRMRSRYRFNVFAITFTAVTLWSKQNWTPSSVASLYMASTTLYIPTGYQAPSLISA